MVQVQLSLGRKGRAAPKAASGLKAARLQGTDKESFSEFASFPHTQALAFSSPGPPCLGLVTTPNQGCGLPAPQI